METQGKPYWHIHHEVLWEFATEPIENRIEYIQTQKAPSERELRLHLLKPIINCPSALLWAYAEYDKACAEFRKAWAEYYKACAEWYKAVAEFDKACAEYNKAVDKYDKARAEYYKAWAEWNKVRAEYTDEMEALHKIECPNCPWNGSTIFPE